MGSYYAGFIGKGLPTPRPVVVSGRRFPQVWFGKVPAESAKVGQGGVFPPCLRPGSD